MNDLIPALDEKDFLNGSLLEESLFMYGNNDLIEKYKTTIKPNSFNTNDSGNFLENLGNTLQQLSSKINSNSDIIKSLKKDVLNQIRNNQLKPFGFQLPRNTEDKPISIPIDLVLNGEIDWNKSEFQAQGISFAGIRLLNNEKTISERNNKEIKEKPNSISNYDNELHIDEKEAAKILGLSPRTLQGYRLKGDGPQFIKIGKKAVRYKIADLKEWSESNKKNNTSEY